MKHLALLLLVLAGVALAGCNDASSPMDQGMTAEDHGTRPDTSLPEDGGVVEDSSITGDNGVPQDVGIGSDSSAPTCVESQVGAGAQNVAICPLATPARHVRIVGLTAARAHASTQLFLGLTDAVGPQAPLTAGQFKLQLYGGGQPQPPPDLGAYFGPDAVGFDGPHDFINTVSTVCLDVHPGSVSTRAVVVLWLDGRAGADCEDPSTLTFGNRYGHAWAPSPGALNDDGVYFYQSGGAQTPVVTLSDTPALAYEDVPPPECTVAPIVTTASERYVDLCAVDGPVRHVRITDVAAVDPHGTVSVLVGYPAPANTGVGPAAPSSTSQLRVQMYGGFSMAAQGPRMDLHYGATTTTVAGSHAFLSTPSTLCFDLHEGSATTPPTFILWRDGENGADCEDFATLTPETAFDSVSAYGPDGDVVGALDKSVPLYLYQNTGGSSAAVTLSSRSAVAL